MEDRIKALLVAYAFPPAGGAGVQRPAKLVKYLRHHDVEPIVLTSSNPSVPVRDESLVSDIPKGTEIIRVRTLEPAYGVKQVAWRTTAGASGRPSVTKALARAARTLLVPDSQVLWLPLAGLKFLSLLRNPSTRPDAVLITAPPFSQFLLTFVAAIPPTVGIVLDYRDEWTTLRSSYEMHGTRWFDKIADRLEERVLSRAHVVITATEEFRENLRTRFPKLDAERVVAIPNGFDSDDFRMTLPEPPTDRLTLTHAGTLFKLTSPRGLVGALRRIRERNPALLRHIRVKFVGRIVDTELDLFHDADKLSIERKGYVPHTQVLHELASGHVCLCLLDAVEGVERIYPQKIFELMNLPRQVLTLAPPGALTRLVARHRVGKVIEPRDEGAIAQHLDNMIREFADGRLPMVPEDRDVAGIQRYDRRALAGEFARELRNAVVRAKVSNR